MHTQNLNPTQQHLPKSVTVQEVIRLINNAALSRRYAFSAYSKKYACFYEKLATIEAIISKLAQASNCVNQNKALSLILQTEKEMALIAPRETSKLYKTFTDNINDLYRACRLALGREVQHGV